MGCGGAKDVKATVDMTIVTKTVQTGILDFDNVFMMLAEALKEAENIRSNVVPARYNMMRIVKAHHLHEPTIVDAFKLWTWGVSCCNEGNASGNGVYYSFNGDYGLSFDLGLCGEARFQYFGQYLNNFLYYHDQAKAAFPEAKKKVDALFDRIKNMKSNVFQYASVLPTTQDKMKAAGLIGVNMYQLGTGVKICEEFQKTMEKYQKEKDDLIAKHYEIEQNADTKGAKIFHDYPPKELAKLDQNESTKYIMGRKMNDIVYYYMENATRRDLAEQQEETKAKEERAKNKPRKTKEYKPNDLPLDPKGKNFPFRLIWVGLNLLDQPLQQISVCLEDHTIQRTKLKAYRNAIRHKLGTYVLQNDNMYEAFRVFLWAFLGNNELKVKLEVKDESPYILALEKTVSKDKELEEIKLYFLQYLQWVCPTRLVPLDNSWTSYKQNCGKLINDWSNGSFIIDPTFRQSKIQDQYNVITNLTKNIYALRAYKPFADRLYNAKFAKRNQESQQFWHGIPQALVEAEAKKATCKGVAFAEVVNKAHDGPKNQDAAKVAKKKEKLAKQYEDLKKTLVK